MWLVFRGFRCAPRRGACSRSAGSPVCRSAPPTELYTKCSTPADLAASARRMPSSDLTRRAPARGHRGHCEDARNPVESRLETCRVVEIGDGQLRAGSCEGLRGRFLRVADQRPYPHPGTQQSPRGRAALLSGCSDDGHHARYRHVLLRSRGTAAASSRLRATHFSGRNIPHNGRVGGSPVVGNASRPHGCPGR